MTYTHENLGVREVAVLLVKEAGRLVEEMPVVKRRRQWREIQNIVERGKLRLDPRLIGRTK